jgi:hypothetical protein
VLDARTERAWKRPWALLALAGALLGVSLAGAAGAASELGIGSLRLSDAPERPSPGEAELYVTLSGVAGTAPGERAFKTSVEVVTAQLGSDPAVGSLRAIERGDRVILIAGFGRATDAERQNAAARIAATIDPGALRATVGGEVPRAVAARDELEDELWRKGLMVVPLALLALVAAAGLRRAAAPLLCAAIAVAGSFALLRLAGAFADVSLLGLAPAAAVGLVLGVELALRALASPDAPEREPRLALALAGVAALPGFALLATPLDQAPSLALGAALAALLAAAATRLVVPPIVVVSRAGAASSTASRRVLLRTRRRALVALGVGAAALAALASLGVAYGATASQVALDAPDAPVRSLDDSLFGFLALPGALAAGAAAVAIALLARTGLAVVLGPLSMLPAAAGLGVCAWLSESGTLIGGSDASGAFLDTGAVAIAVCALAAVACSRSASAALWFSAGRRIELRPVLAATAIGLLATGALYATRIEAAEQLAIALAAGLLADLLLLRLPLTAVVNRWVGSTP